MSNLDKEAKELYDKLLLALESDEDISISEFYEKYASEEFKKNSKRLEERRKRLYAKGIIEG